MGEGHHHGGDMGGSPGMSPPPVPHHHAHHHPHASDAPHLADPFDARYLTNPADPMNPVDRRRRGGVRLPPPPVGSARWVTRWILRLVFIAIIAFFVFVAYQVFHGVTATPSP